MIRSKALSALFLAGTALAACDRPAEQTAPPAPAAAPPPVTSAAPPPPPPPPTPPNAPSPTPEPAPQPAPNEQASDDWRVYARPADVDRLERLNRAWSAGLKRARAEGYGDELDALGALARPGGGQTSRVQPAPGQYRCRTIKLGGEANGLAYVPYPYFKCEVELTPGGDLIVRKLTGSQRFEGKLYPDRENRLVYLGAAAWGSSETPPDYGENPERDQVGVVERVGPQRWRLAIAWPVAESSLDIIELVK